MTVGLDMNDKKGGDENGKEHDKHPHPVDIHVGARLRYRRLFLSLSQKELASLVGVTYQQIQKYENGTNRIGSSRLFDIASALKVPIETFFEDLGEKHAPPQADSLPSQEEIALAREIHRADPRMGAAVRQLLAVYHEITASPPT